MTGEVVVGEVRHVFRYPVKSLDGEQLDRVEVDRRGVAGDRLWCVRDLDGKFGSSKSSRRFRRMPGLLELRASYDGDIPVLTFPYPAPHSVVRGDEDSVHDALSSHVGRSVRLAREEAVPHFDEGPVHLVTTASLHSAAGGAPVDARRPRANLVIHTAAGVTESTWVGRRLRVGPSVELAVTAPMPRCVMLGMAQAGLEADRDLLTDVTRRNNGELGVVAEVLRPGLVAVGDEVRLD